jgi:hypothetical protein
MSYKNPTQKVVKLVDLIGENKLSIPEYQRPYKWSEKNVLQLLDDIFYSVELINKDYRIGNLIIHEDEGKKLNVVDGQQRLTTISILLKVLEKEFNQLLLAQEYKHTISKNNISYNYRIISQWVDTKFSTSDSKKEFNHKILNKSEFVLFTVFEQEEAFQLFDTQNARGKALEPYDLLKAFHLREMEFDSEEERIKCVEIWEKSVDDKTLKPILGNHLYRIRKWSKNEHRYNFTRDEINEFKGVSLHKKPLYPYESTLRMLDGFIDDAQKNKFLRNLQIAQSYPFSINMPIINGKRFFEYVEYYITQREKLFDFNKEDSIKAINNEFVVFYENYCLNYPGHTRSGDEKVRNLYENILMAFLDKFGYTEDFDNYYYAFYKMAYFIRCSKNRITLETILNDDAKNIFTKLNNALSPDELKSYQFKRFNLNKENVVNGIDNIIEFILTGKLLEKTLIK